MWYKSQCHCLKILFHLTSPACCLLPAATDNVQYTTMIHLYYCIVSFADCYCSAPCTIYLEGLLVVFIILLSVFTLFSLLYVCCPYCFGFDFYFDFDFNFNFNLNSWTLHATAPNITDSH